MFNLELTGHNRTKQSKEEKTKTTPHKNKLCVIGGTLIVLTIFLNLRNVFLS